MPETTALHTFNRGLVSSLALARVELPKLALSASVMVNWTPRILGPMSLRNGLKYIGTRVGVARYLPFIFSTNDTAILEISNLALRVWINDTLLSRVSVSTAVTDPTFVSNASTNAAWAINDVGASTSAWISAGRLGFTGTSTDSARRRQTLTVAAGDLNKVHALHIVVERGPIIFRLGSSAGDDSYINETTLDTGTHSLAFTPTGSVYIEFSSPLLRLTVLNSCTIELSGAVSITAPVISADLDKIRYDQSGDIVFIACSGYKQFKIERRAKESWSVVKYYSNDGPFDFVNNSPITMAISSVSIGNPTLTASKAYFKSTHVGALFSVTSVGQIVTRTGITSAPTYTTTDFRITGVGATRTFTIIITGFPAAGTTVQLQRSLTTPGSWEDVAGQSWTANSTTTYADALDNQIVYYRLGVSVWGGAGGPINVTMQTGIGSITGIGRVTGFTSSTIVDIEMLKSFGGTKASDIWREGLWSDKKGWPGSVAFHEGRLWFSGKNGIWASVSDSYYSFDDTTVGDSGPIDRTIGSGPVDTINWLLSLSRLIVGSEGSEFVCKSSSQDQPITPSNFGMRATSTQGSGNVAAIKIDKNGIFVTRGTTRLFEIAIEEKDYEYGSGDLTSLVPGIGNTGIVRIAVQRQPDTRVHCVRSDGTVALMIIDKNEQVLCWHEVKTDGAIEDVVILPGANGTGEDAVYYANVRTIGGLPLRYLERYALTSNCIGGTLNHQADCYIQFTTGSETTTITGLSVLEGKTVCVWANGKDLGTYVVSAGIITGVTEPVTSAIVGLPYTATWQSTKLATTSQNRVTTLTHKKNISNIGVILENTHYQGLEYGKDFTNMDNLPLVKDGAIVAADTVHATYDQEPFTFPGEWNTDERICLRATAPRPCTVLALTMPIEIHGKY